MELVHPRRFDAATFRQGIHEALLAAAEEHDRDPDEVISPATVECIAEDPRGGGFRIGYEDPQWALLVQTRDGRIFRVVATEVSGEES